MVMASSGDLPAKSSATSAEPQGKQAGASDTFDRSLRTRILQAAGWSMMGYISGYGLRLVSSLIMTRLLVPEMFGVMAVATIVQMVAANLCDVGLRQAVPARRRRIRRRTSLPRPRRRSARRRAHRPPISPRPGWPGA